MQMSHKPSFETGMCACVRACVRACVCLLREYEVSVRVREHCECMVEERKCVCVLEEREILYFWMVYVRACMSVSV